MNTTFKPAAKLSLLTSALLASFAASATADIEQITIFGKKNPVNTVPGSAHQLSQEELDTFKYSDIMRTLASVPGIYIQEEEGYGLRPNLGMRGTGQNRSEKVTVMEDGVLAAPAPYASPAAYYFPTSGRMQQIEVLKGSSTVKYGPRTTGGVINMLSRQIPDAPAAGAVDMALGQDGFGKLHAHAGGQGERIGAVTEVYRYQADGFRDINGVGGDTGFVKNDLLAKVALNSAKDARYAQRLELKLKYADEVSNETYLGLTDEDFESRPHSRYSASQKDEMSTEHKQVQLNHIIDFSDITTLSTTAYYNHFHRNWYKADKVGGKSLSAGGVANASAFDRNPVGSIDVSVKANNRDYLSQGLQTELGLSLGEHQLDIGARLHSDEMDRFQWVDSYSLDESQTMRLTKAGIPGTDSNRIDSADAFAAYVQDKFTVGAFTVTAGVRYEDVTVSREDWGKNNVGRDGAGKETDNSFSAWLPSLSATWQLNDNLLLLAGVQKGFAPAAPGNAEGEEEQSWNYEAGGRYVNGEFSAEAIAFYGDYSNMHGNCTAAQGCDADKLDNQYNAGEVAVSGLELSAAHTFNARGALSFPVKAAYTFTDTEFQNSFESEFDTWGSIEAGYEFSYTPAHQLYLSAGVSAEQWELTLAGRYTSDMRASAGRGEIAADDLIAAKTLVDLSGRYFIDKQQEVYLTVDNLLDETYVTTRAHGSVFSGKPRSVTVGYSYKF
ncbi:TonB-dependent receptor [Shewanella sp. JM162201]|uniref:TonB-dependent receptor n=1 Tax=Shewanella jiangmenensis TaxID=2837387 RepID=A0ABS5V361_9GAMM|nr:TonB-dependent receptor [Shewanella jiangmenensis]MBT1444251.1 TonB-dependent receptor [Shewanella jiangmenensis]